MLKLAFIFPVVLGVFSVLQGTLNKKIAGYGGTPLVTAANFAGLLIASVVVFYIFGQKHGQSQSTEPFTFSVKFLWILLPGLLGIFFVVGLPWCIGQMGTPFVFACFIGSQIVASLLWDQFIEKIPTSPWGYCGAALSVLGALCFSVSK